MESANLPLLSAQEPDEEARQPEVQLDSGVSQRQRLLWLQQRRSTGLWVKCDECGRWRFLPHVLDSHELPRLWYCKMNPDAEAAHCSVPESRILVRDEEDLIHSEYSAGSLVLARLAGWPWWPAMVDDCPETEQFYWIDMYSDIPTHYNVVFFDSNNVGIQRAWVTPKMIKPYGQNKNKKDFQHLLRDSVYSDRLMAAVKQAKDAESLPLPKRLTKYGFASRYRGEIHKPGTIKKKVLKKFQNKLKRKFNVAFESDSDGNSDREEMQEKKELINLKNQLVLMGTPKISKGKIIIPKGTNKQIPDSNNELEDIIITNGAVSESAKGGETNIENDSAKEILKQQPNSLAVQAGSAISTALTSESFDNDTSKTYVPKSDSELESVSAITNEINKFQQRATRYSIDFEFSE